MTDLAQERDGLRAELGRLHSQLRHLQLGMNAGNRDTSVQADTELASPATIGQVIPAQTVVAS